MIRRPPRSTRTDTLVPYTTLFRSIDRQRHRQCQSVFHPCTSGIPADRDALDPADRRISQRRRSLLRDQVPRGIVSRGRSEEHTSELQSLMRISYAVFCLKKKKIDIILTNN